MDASLTWGPLLLIGVLLGGLSCAAGPTAAPKVVVDHSSPEALVQSLFEVARARDGVAIRSLCSSQAMGLENGNFCAARDDTELWTLGFVQERFGSCAAAGPVRREGDVAHVPYACRDQGGRTPIAVTRVDGRWYLHPEPNL